MEAFILVKTVPGKTREVVRQLAEEGEDGKSYNIQGMMHVYRASGDYDVIAHVSAKSVKGIFDIAERIGRIHGSQESGVSGTQTILLIPKIMGDP